MGCGCKNKSKQQKLNQQLQQRKTNQTRTAAYLAQLKKNNANK